MPRAENKPSGYYLVKCHKINSSRFTDRMREVHRRDSGCSVYKHLFLSLHHGLIWNSCSDVPPPQWVTVDVYLGCVFPLHTYLTFNVSIWK